MQLGERQFTDGTTRPVYRSDDGRQYVLDDEGELGPTSGRGSSGNPSFTNCKTN